MAFPRSHMKDQRLKIVKLVRQLGCETLGIQPTDIKLGGPTVDGAAIDYESKRSLDQFHGTDGRGRFRADLVPDKKPRHVTGGSLVFGLSALASAWRSCFTLAAG